MTPSMQNEKLHGNFADRVEHQSQPAFAQRWPRNISLDLRPIGAEIREGEKHSAKQSGPERISPVQTERKFDTRSIF